MNELEVILIITGIFAKFLFKNLERVFSHILFISLLIKA